MKPPKYLYHATATKNWEKIQKEGLKPFFPAVYMTQDLKAAEFFAGWHQAGSKKSSVIIKINTKGLREKHLGRNEEMLCRILNVEDFWHYYGTIKPQYLSLMGSKEDEQQDKSN